MSLQHLSAHPTSKVSTQLNHQPINNLRAIIIFIFAAPGIYCCPCYYFPNRAGGSGRASFVVAVDLKAGSQIGDHWVKRGTALLMSLDH